MTARALLRFLRHLAYLAIFWPIFLLVRLLTVAIETFGLARLAAGLRARARPRPKILFLAAFFPGNAGFEERASSWVRILEAAGFHARVSFCLPRDRFWSLLAPGRGGWFQLSFMARRLWQCWQALFFDAVVVQRELLLFNDYGGTFGEQWLRALNPRIALDLDDDISAAKGEPRAVGAFGRLLLESGTKFADSLRHYPRFIVGSAYLERLVRDRRPDLAANAVAVIPTCIDPLAYPRKRYEDSPAGTRPLALGWIGSSGNLQYLDHVLPGLEAVAREHAIKLVVISGEAYRPNATFEIENVPWSFDTQGESLLKIDLGLMPLFDTAVERGKCGFKLLQYMACGIVSLASAITVNAEIVTDGEDGYLVHDDDWARAIRRVIGERHRFPEIGARAVARVREHYTFEAHREAYLCFCRELSGRRAVTR